MYCSKCAKEAPTTPAHIGKKHRACGNRKFGQSKEHSGRWQDSKPGNEKNDQTETETKE